MGQHAGTKQRARRYTYMSTRKQYKAAHMGASIKLKKITTQAPHAKCTINVFCCHVHRGAPSEMDVKFSIEFDFLTRCKEKATPGQAGQDTHLWAWLNCLLPSNSSGPGFLSWLLCQMPGQLQQAFNCCVGVPMHVFVLVIYVIPAALFFASAACFVFSR